MVDNNRTHHNLFIAQTGGNCLKIAEFEEELARLLKDGSPPKLDEGAALKLDIERLKRAAKEKENSQNVNTSEENCRVPCERTSGWDE